jgi:lipoprotein-releasing system permease protein
MIMKKSVNVQIAITHIVTRKRQTLIAALGVAIGVAIHLFMNSLSAGFTRFSRNEIFKNSAHIKIFKDDEISRSVLSGTDSQQVTVIVNPQITTLSKKLINPEQLLEQVKSQPYVTAALAQINFDAFYNMGKAQITGAGSGVDMTDYDAMFNFSRYMVAGSIASLQGNLNGIIIGSGIAEKLSLEIDDNITVSSSYGVAKVMKVVGIFTTGNSLNDQSKSYMNVSASQQFIREGPSYVSTMFVNTPDPDNVEEYARKLRQITSYTVEDWKTTNADVLASDKTRNTLLTAISLSILLVAAFGIYNILSATITQKINDIAILKATGFSGKDVIRIFILESVVMGVIGTIAGLMFSSVLIWIVSGIYVGGPVGYFPVGFEPRLYTQSFFLGVMITLCAGYFPAKKAADVDPVAIFRK